MQRRGRERRGMETGFRDMEMNGVEEVEGRETSILV